MKAQDALNEMCAEGDRVGGDGNKTGDGKDAIDALAKVEAAIEYLARSDAVDRWEHGFSVK